MHLALMDAETRRRTASRLMKDDPQLAAQLFDSLFDLVRERDAYGGVPNTSPAWDFARAAINRVLWSE